MRTIIITIVALASFAGSGFAADIIELPASIGKVTFDHKKHADMLKECSKCHAAAAGGKIADLGKEWAHKTCKGCHAEMKKGPQGCKECHKK